VIKFIWYNLITIGLIMIIMGLGLLLFVEFVYGVH